MTWKKILFADDIELFLELEQTFFRREGFELLVARSGEQALEMAAAERPDLIFLRAEMPGMRGEECCRRLKQDPSLRSVPVVMVTEGGSPEALTRAREAGCDDLLTRPINRHHLLQTANRFLRVTERNDPRVPARLRVHYGSGPQKLLANYSVNLSTGGVFIETLEVLPIETPLTLEFILPHVERTVRCRGRVAWVNHPDRIVSPRLPAGMGVQFLDLSLDDMHALREFVKNQCLHPTW